VTVASPAADAASFPYAAEIITNFDAGSATFSSAPLVVVATQGKGDQAALQAALRVDTFHRAFIASKRKADKLKQLLKDKGHDPQAVDGIIAPAGVEIGANSPEEIAVSVLAGLIAARNARMAMPEELPVNNAAATAVAVAPIEQAVPADSSSSPVESGCCGSNPAT
jgi:xanthine dehydrogenase accessory factor